MIKNLLGTLLIAACLTIGLGGGADHGSTAAKPATASVARTKAPAPVPIGTVPVGQIVQLGFTDLTADVARKSHLGYYPRPSGAIFFPAVGLDGNVAVFFSSPTAAKILVWIDSPGADGKVEHAEMEVTVGTPGPGPTPDPDPVPPTPAKLWGAVIIEESSQRTSCEAAVYTSQELALYASTTGVTIRLADKDEKDKAGNPTPDIQGYVARAAKAGQYPRVFVVSVDGDILSEGPLPSTSSALVALLREKGGTK